MDSSDVVLVKKIVVDTLAEMHGPDLDRRCREIEANVLANVTAFENSIRHEVRQDHAENRTRLQLLSEQASTAAEKAKAAAEDAAKAVAGNEYIVSMLGDQNNRSEGIRKLVLDLLGEVRSLTGKSEGIAEAEARQEKKETSRMNVIKWIFGLFSSAGVYRWLANHFHWPGGK